MAAEREAEFKSAYYDGEVFAMSGASRAYNLLVSNLVTSLNNRLGDMCSVFLSDRCVHIPADGPYTYPGVSVVCGEEQYLDDAYLDTLLNPVVLLEVISMCTDKSDRGSKFILYKSIASLQYYALVDSQRIVVGMHSRMADRAWLYQEVEGLDATLQLPALNVALPLSELYRKVSLPN